MQVHYLEIVTPDVEAVCEAYAQSHNVEFGEGDPNLVGARTAKLRIQDTRGYPTRASTTHHERARTEKERFLSKVRKITCDNFVG